MKDRYRTYCMNAGSARRGLNMIHLELFHNYTAVPLYRWGDFVGISSTFLSPWLGFSKISISGSATMYTHGVLVQKLTK